MGDQSLTSPTSMPEEPVFASKANHDYRRFRRRGLAAARSEWALMATAHNLGKLHRTS
jgi:hypothetical protein